MSNTNSIGSFLAALRKAHGFTQKQLAEKLSVSDKAVSCWERDECAPDLSLIPVLAELYGITSDEILRGRRADPNVVTPQRNDESSQKRLKYLLRRIQTDYQARSLIACMIAAVGLIIAMVLNFAFHRSYAGFLVGCIFFLAAAVCQAIFYIQSRTCLESDEFEESLILTGKKSLFFTTEKAFSTITLLFIAATPFIMTGEPYWGLTFHSWLNAMAMLDIATLLLCLLVCHVINNRIFADTRSEEEKTLQQKMDLYQLGTLALAVILFILAPFWDANPEQVSVSYVAMQVTGLILVLANIIIFVVFMIRNQVHRRLLRLTGIRNILLCIPTILTTEIHSSTWHRISETIMGVVTYKRESSWDSKYITLSLAITLSLFILFGMLRNFLDKRKAK